MAAVARGRHGAALGVRVVFKVALVRGEGDGAGEGGDDAVLRPGERGKRGEVGAGARRVDEVAEFRGREGVALGDLQERELGAEEVAEYLPAVGGGKGLRQRGLGGDRADNGLNGGHGALHEGAAGRTCARKSG